MCLRESYCVFVKEIHEKCPLHLPFSTRRFLITQTEFLVCFITIRVLSDEIKFTVNFDVPCQIFACKIYSFSSGCPSVESRDPRAFEKTCKCRKFFNITFLCCRRKVLLNCKTSFLCEKPRVFQSDLNISQILTNFNGVCNTNMAFHIFPYFSKTKILWKL